MAQFRASVAVDFLNFDLGPIYFSSFDTTLLDNVFATHNGRAYEDVIFEAFFVAGRLNFAGFAGTGLRLDSNNLYVGGRIQFFGEFVEGGQFITELTGIDLDARRVNDVMMTRSTADDQALLRQALSAGDRIELSNFDDRALGYDGNDTIFGNGGNDALLGGNGNDRLFGGSGNDRLLGEAGNDHIEGGTGSDTLIGGTGNDTLLGGSGIDRLHLDDGDDVLRGGDGSDWLVVGARGATVDLAISGPQNTGYGRDVIAGIPNIQGGAGNDVLMGNAAANILLGGGGNDRLFGRLGADRLEGNAGNDLLDGGLGNDTLLGGLGNDTLIGGTGTDVLTGGPGADVFVFRSLGDTSRDPLRADLITDFQRGSDRIDLREIDANVNRAGNDVFSFIGTAELSRAGQVSYVRLDRPGTQNDFTDILLDVNGDGRPDGVIRLQGLYDLTANDFLL